MSDYISREAVKQFLRMEMKFSLEAMVADPEIIPSADVRENIHGEWIEHDIKELRDLGYYRCSVCRKGFKRFDKGIRKSDVPWIDGQPFELHIVDNYCPNCGADMRGKQNE